VRATASDEVLFEDGFVHQPASVVWATGFRPDYSWIHVPDVIADGQVVHDRGRTTAPGLFFIGLPWQHTRGSALLGFVQHDAEWLATHLTAHPRREVPSGA
jgi:putative flavoprotein involved in K+ transport